MRRANKFTQLNIEQFALRLRKIVETFFRTEIENKSLEGQILNALNEVEDLLIKKTRNRQIGYITEDEKWKSMEKILQAIKKLSELMDKAGEEKTLATFARLFSESTKKENLDSSDKMLTLVKNFFPELNLVSGMNLNEKIDKLLAAIELQKPPKPPPM